ncbi:F-box protein [Cardamine amara subsp. amara]|uniref:F-box protein n=1 Tax=Cardamine amara subsp. amara TaxID=228776 RepID=A0ABD1BQD6_CARAN
MERQRAKKNISDDPRTSGGNSDLIPVDIIREILKRLPVKTLVRFLCVSKQFAYIHHSQPRLQEIMLAQVFQSSSAKSHLHIREKHLRPLEVFLLLINSASKSR